MTFLGTSSHSNVNHLLFCLLAFLYRTPPLDLALGVISSSGLTDETPLTPDVSPGAPAGQNVRRS